MPLTEGGPPASTATREALTARLDRLPGWSLSYLFIAIIGLGFLFTFYDIFDINVSFIQTCVQIQPGCTPPTAVSFLTLPVTLNLVGYVIGTLILSEGDHCVWAFPIDAWERFEESLRQHAQLSPERRNFARVMVASANSQRMTEFVMS